MFGDNIKVHFAGCNGESNFFIASKAANVRYRLYTVYEYIRKPKFGDDLRLPKDHIMPKQVSETRHIIQDSGLFTLMFGAAKGQNITKEFLTQWQDRLMQFVIQNHLPVTCVEIDCQKVLGVREAWWFRERMRKMLPNKQINVFHYEDGRDGLDALIEFADYIAISVPELRIAHPRTFREDTHKLAYYIKNKKPEIDIHLLGCTDFRMLKTNSFCTSADSTSWLQGVKYGYISDGKTKDHINNFNREIFVQRKKKCTEYFEKYCSSVPGERLLDYTTNASICASICRKRYTQMAGNQD